MLWSHINFWHLRVSIWCIDPPATDPSLSLATTAFGLCSFDVIPKAKARTKGDSVQQEHSGGESSSKDERYCWTKCVEPGAKDRAEATTKGISISTEDLNRQEHLGVTQWVEEAHVSWPLATVNVACAHEDLPYNCYRQPGAKQAGIEDHPWDQNTSDSVRLRCQAVPESTTWARFIWIIPTWHQKGNHLHHQCSHNIASCLGQTCRSCFIPAVHFLEEKCKSGELDDICGCVGEAVQHDQEYWKPYIFWESLSEPWFQRSRWLQVFSPCNCHPHQNIHLHLAAHVLHQCGPQCEASSPSLFQSGGENLGQLLTRLSYETWQWTLFWQSMLLPRCPR